MRFKVTINDEKECIAGFRDYAVLSTTVSRVKRNPEHMGSEQINNVNPERHLKEEIRVHVGGMDGNRADQANGVHLTWLDMELKVGDKVTIELLPPGEVDQPLVSNSRAKPKR